MLIVIANITVKNGKGGELLGKAQNLVDNTRLEEGNIEYNIFSSTEDENDFVVLEQWTTQDALDEHLETDHFNQFVKDTEDVLAKDIDINVYTVN